MPYSTPPGPRIAYDIDGTAVLIKNTADLGSTINDVDQPSKNLLNSEIPASSLVITAYESTAPDGSPTPRWQGVMANGSWIAFVFPTPMKIAGVLAAFGVGSVPVEMLVSSDSTNGDDGTWTLLGEVTPVTAPNPPGVYTTSTGDNIYYVNRSYLERNPYINFALPAINDLYRRLYDVDGAGIRTLSGAAVRNVKAVRFRLTPATAFGQNYYTHMAMKIHLYGSPDTAAVTDRLEFWQLGQDLATPAGWFDWGNVPLSSSADKSFRLKNNSLTRTASDIQISAIPGLTPTNPSPNTYLFFSVDSGATWTSSCVLGALSPGAVSGVILLRRVIPANATLSNWAPRISATAGSWV